MVDIFKLPDNVIRFITSIPYERAMGSYPIQPIENSPLPGDTLQRLVHYRDSKELNKDYILYLNHSFQVVDEIKEISRIKFDIEMSEQESITPWYVHLDLIGKEHTSEKDIGRLLTVPERKGVITAHSKSIFVVKKTQQTDYHDLDTVKGWVNFFPNLLIPKKHNLKVNRYSWPL